MFTIYNWKARLLALAKHWLKPRPTSAPLNLKKHNRRRREGEKIVEYITLKYHYDKLIAHSTLESERGRGLAILVDVLSPALQSVELDSDDVVVVDLDDAVGWASSFLSALFGGAGSMFNEKFLKKHLVILSFDEPYLEDECWIFIHRIESLTDRY